jgi:hypothetical protein
MHPAHHRLVRRSEPDPKLWNQTCDYAMNPLLADAGLSLPDGVLLDNRFRGMSAEQIRNLLDSETTRGCGGGDAKRDLGGEGREAERSLAGEVGGMSAPVTEGNRPGARCACARRGILDRYR